MRTLNFDVFNLPIRWNPFLVLLPILRHSFFYIGVFLFFVIQRGLDALFQLKIVFHITLNGKNDLYFTGLLDVLCCSLCNVGYSGCRFLLSCRLMLHLMCLWRPTIQMHQTCCIYIHFHPVCPRLIIIVLYLNLQSIITEINHAIGATGVVSQECKAVVAEYGETIIKMILEKVCAKLTYNQNHASNN